MKKVGKDRKVQRNQHVSSSTLSRAERHALLELQVLTGCGRKGSKSVRQRSEVWNYFGYLHTVVPAAAASNPIPGSSTSSDTVEVTKALEDDRIYCKLCLEREQKRYRDNSHGHISKVKHYGNSSTCTLREHLRLEHQLQLKLQEASDDDDDRTVSAPTAGKRSVDSNPSELGKGLKQQKLSFRKKLENFEPFTSQYELNRDFAIWAALDLQPFAFTQDEGMTYFFQKNFPQIELPSRNTIARLALSDVYDIVMKMLKDELRAVLGTGISIMFDGWTDKHKKYPYLGLRVAYIDNHWKYRIITLSCKVLEKHTAASISDHVRQELELIGVDMKQVFVFSVNDGAANMVKASKLLNVSDFQHCIAHCIHLHLMSDGIRHSPEIVDLLERCKHAIGKLLFKSCLIQDEVRNSEDREVMNAMYDKLMNVDQELQADSAIGIGCDGEDTHEQESSDGRAEERFMGRHETLKQPCITRWNSVLTMIESVLCLWNEMAEALKRNGDREYCLSENDKDILVELRNVLMPFHNLTKLVSCQQPTLGLLPLIVKEIRDILQSDNTENDIAKELKTTLLAAVDHRLKVSDTVHLTALLDPVMKHFVISEKGEDWAKQALKDKTLKAVHRRSSVSRVRKSEASASATVSAGSAGHTQANTLAVTESDSCASMMSMKKKLLDKHGSSAEAGSSLVAQVECEIVSYLTFQSTEENPLNFWKHNQRVFPNLAIAAKTYLCASAASVPVEQMFSSTGLILNMKQSSMSPSRLNMLSFIHDNHHKFYPISKVAATASKLAE